MNVYAREELASTSRAQGPRLLLEGDWTRATDEGWSLDETIDCRHAWIDLEAARLSAIVESSSRDENVPTIGYLNALRLRYYFVKLLRVIAFFDDVYPIYGQTVHLYVEAGRDEDYVDLFEAVAEARSFSLCVHRREPAGVTSKAKNERGAWRSLAARADRWLNASSFSAGSRRRVVLCGDPRVLDPVCGAMLRRSARVAWLYDRWAARSWFRWRRRGVIQLTCHGRFDAKESLPSGDAGDLFCRGVPLRRPIERFLEERRRESGNQQSHWIAQIRRNFHRFRPDALVLDQDATPFARAALSVAREFGAATAVVQHGVPVIRFGFSPLSANAFLAWGPTSKAQLVSWGVPQERIVCVGHPRREQFARRMHEAIQIQGSSDVVEILLLATVPPRDERPDAVSYHLTTRTHRDMLRAAMAAVTRLKHARLIIKTHPRTTSLADFGAVRAEFPELDVEIVRRGDIGELVGRASCVISCGSSAGVEATLAGKPVIFLAPAGSNDLLRATSWGMIGVARDEQSLQSLLDAAIAGEAPATGAVEDIFGPPGSAAADQIASAVLNLIESKATPINAMAA